MKARLTFAAMAFFSSQAFGGTLYAFEELLQQHQEVPAGVGASLRKLFADSIKECQGQLNLSGEQMQSYFTSRVVELPGSGTNALLVLPTQRCYAFFGAHSVAFWLFLVEPTGPRLVLTNRQDALEVRALRSGGLPDISTRYGTSETNYRYDGRQYVPVPK
jgi:hypothetical protein